MHELGIATSLLDCVRTEATRYPGTHPIKVGVRIGELAGIDPSALRFCFEAIVRDTDLEPVKLEIEIRRRRHRCLACGCEFEVSDYDFQCPQCAGMSTECIGGDELELSYLEVEEYEPSAIGAKSTE
jgi:hydrogenase nickel incorporation protein HypA/HybF